MSILLVPASKNLTGDATTQVYIKHPENIQHKSFHAKEFLEAGYAVIFLHRKGVPCGEWTCDPNVDRIQGILTGIFQSGMCRWMTRIQSYWHVLGGFDSCWRYHMSVSKIWGIPQWMVKIMGKTEKPIKIWMIWGGKNPLFSETSINWFVFHPMSSHKKKRHRFPWPFASKLDADGKTLHTQFMAKLNCSKEHWIFVCWFGPTLVKGLLDDP